LYPNAIRWKSYLWNILARYLFHLLTLSEGLLKMKMNCMSWSWTIARHMSANRILVLTFRHIWVISSSLWTCYCLDFQNYKADCPAPLLRAMIEGQIALLQETWEKVATLCNFRFQIFEIWSWTM
jgi:hypothetical protein